MFHRLTLPTFALALALPTAAFASCEAGNTVLSCTAKNGAKSLDVCLFDGAVTYSYGATGAAPDLMLDAHVAEITHMPWSGMGGSIWEETTFFNKDFSYVIWMSVDRNNPDAPPMGGVTVQKGGAEIAQVACDSVGIELGLFAISDAKAQMGQCWDGINETWGRCP